MFLCYDLFYNSTIIIVTLNWLRDNEFCCKLYFVVSVYAMNSSSHGKRTVDVTFKKCFARESSWKYNPTTAAGARCPLDSTNTAWVARTRGGFPLKSSGSEPSRKGTE